MRDAIIEAVKMSPGTSFVELMRIEGARGDMQMFLEGNIVLWSGVSDEFIDGVNAAIKSGEIVPRASVPLVYMADGGMLELPIAQKPPKGGYRKPHWAPVVFWPKGRVPGETP